MNENKQRKVINMSSQMAFVGSYVRPAYCSSRDGLTPLMKAFALD